MFKKRTLGKVLFKPRKLIKILGNNSLFNWLPDKLYLRLVYWGETGKKLNLKNPTTFTEKLQWLKLNNRKNEFSTYVDKYAVREYISETLGDQYLIPLLAVYNNVEQINWNNLPKQFVLKCNHGSGSNIICTNKSKLDIEKSIKEIENWMNKSWFWFGREWPYKNMEKKIIIEKLLHDQEQVVPKDYKFWVFNGNVEFINVHFTSQGRTKINIYDRRWELQDFGMVYENDLSVKHKKPLKYSEMIHLAEKLAKDLPFVRIDFYEVNGSIYFGEITFYPTSGFMIFYPNHEKLDEKYGNLLKI